VRKFVNDELDAPNVMRVPVDVGALEELRRLSTSKSARRWLFSMSPPWGSDIRWYSSRTKRQFANFRSIFERLGIGAHVEKYLDLDSEVRLYNSFLITRTRCLQTNFHVDWNDANNEGFTMMTPLSDNCSGFGLLYRKLDGSIGDYDYKPGEALIFGDDFVHSTKPGASSEPVVLLCFNFGTDKMEHWPKIEKTAARQGLLICRPDGQFHRLPRAKRLRHLVGSVLRRAGLRRAPAAAHAGY
jgi:hypothetical protein